MQRFFFLVILIVTANISILSAQQSILKIAPIDMALGRYSLDYEYQYAERSAIILGVEYRKFQQDFENLPLFFLAIITLSNEVYTEKGWCIDLIHRNYLSALEKKSRLYVDAGVGYRSADVHIMTHGLIDDYTNFDGSMEEFSAFLKVGQQLKMGERYQLETGIGYRYRNSNKDYDSVFRTMEKWLPSVDIKLGYTF